MAYLHGMGGMLFSTASACLCPGPEHDWDKNALEEVAHVVIDDEELAPRTRRHGVSLKPSVWGKGGGRSEGVDIIGKCTNTKCALK
jgi:hypothetical protein